ncbi:MAG: hypothetical protein ACR2L9_10335 [Solirubrobacteraceae bacterium]
MAVVLLSGFQSARHEHHGADRSKSRQRPQEADAGTNQDKSHHPLAIDSEHGILERERADPTKFVGSCPDGSCRGADLPMLRS